MSLLDAYRRTGADPPFGDPRLAHGVAMEGYYWRVTDAAAGRVVVALCGVCRAPDGVWALVAVAAHPGPFVRTAVVPVASARGLFVSAGDVLVASRGSLRVALDDAVLELRFEEEDGWPRRVFGGLGWAQVAPGLPQYWHPHVLHAPVYGSFSSGGSAVSLDGASLYCEKNWGSTFSRHWWWGQAHAFGDDPAACVAFAGGPIRLAGVPLAPTAVVAAFGGRVIRIGAPFARTSAAAGGSSWHVSARGPLHSIEIEGDAGAHPVPTLPTPVLATRETEPRSHHVLAGRLEVTVRRRNSTLFRGRSDLAGLERSVDLPVP